MHADHFFALVLAFRRHDGGNQSGDLAQGAYSDWTHYHPLNLPLFVSGGIGRVTNLEHRQPLTYADEEGNLETQRFVGAGCAVRLEKRR